IKNAQSRRRVDQGKRPAARNRLRAPSGKTAPEIAKIEDTHQVDRVAEIFSPIAGTVTARKVSPGQFVRADNTDPMFSLGDLSSMWLVANVAEIDIPLVKIGQVVAVPRRGYSGGEILGGITYRGAGRHAAARRA